MSRLALAQVALLAAVSGILLFSETALGRQSPQQVMLEMSETQSLLLESFMRQARNVPLSTGDELLIREIERRANAIDGSGLDEEQHLQLWDLTYRLWDWRLVTMAHLMKRLNHRQTSDEFLHVMLEMSSISGPLLNDSSVERLMQIFRRRDRTEAEGRALALTLVRHGGDFVRPLLKELGATRRMLQYLGPEVPAPYDQFQPYKPSSNEVASTWIDQPWADDYAWNPDEDSIHYQHLVLRPGDMVQCDQAYPGEGGLVQFTKLRSLANHAGVVVFIRRGDRKIPAVLEIHETGARLVPLKFFFSPKFSYRARVFRYPTEFQPRGWSESLSVEAERIVREGYAFNFGANSMPADGVFPPGEKSSGSCVGLIHLLFIRTGVQLPFHRLELDEKVFSNLDRVGLTGVTSLMTPTVLARLDLQSVGTYNTTEFFEDFARDTLLGDATLPHTMVGWFATREIVPGRLPKMDRFDAVFVKLAQRRQGDSTARSAVSAMAESAIYAFHHGMRRQEIPVLNHRAALATYQAYKKEAARLQSTVCAELIAARSLPSDDLTVPFSPIVFQNSPGWVNFISAQVNSSKLPTWFATAQP